MNLKEVFQLAESKGYELVFITVPKMDLYEPLELILDIKNIYLLELTLIQQWLRGTYEIIIEMSFFEDKWYGDVTSISKERRKRPNGSIRRFPSILKNDESSGEVIYQNTLTKSIATALKLLP